MPDPPTRSSFHRYPMLFVAVCFSLGILAGKFAPIDLTVSITTCGILSVAAVAFRTSATATVLVGLAFVAAGIAALQGETLSVPAADRIKVLYDNGSIISGSPVEVEGVVAGGLEPSVDGGFLTMRADSIRYRGLDRTVSGNVRIFVPARESESADDNVRDPEANFKFEISNVRYGSRIRVACRLTHEDEYLNPGVIPKREMLDRLGIDATATVKSPLLVEHIADESVFPPLAWVYDERAALIGSFRQNLSPAAAGVMIASLLGDKYFVDRGTANLFREGGTFHILVISGLQITFIGGLLLLFVRRLTRNRWLQFGVTVSTLWAYTLAVGADVPVVRATVMFTIIMFSYAVYRTGTLLNSLGVCALILLAWRPSDLFNPSFQLTFVSVAAIVGCAYPLIEKLRTIGTWTPTSARPFPPNVRTGLKRFCETIYWNQDAWKIEQKRQIWTANLFKSAQFGQRGIGAVRTAIRYVLEAGVISLIVQLWMLPLVIVYFHRVSVAGVLLNIWVSVFIALESLAAVVGALVMHVSALAARPFFVAADVFNWLVLAVPHLFSDNSRASFRLPAYSGVGLAFYFIYFLPVLFLAVAVNKWAPFDLTSEKLIRRNILSVTTASLLALLAVLVFHPLSSPRPDGRLHVDFLDVGQGDSALVTFPNGETLLIDGGGKLDHREKEENAEPFEADTRRIGEAVVSEVLWYKGYSHVDHILATHADADHIQGLVDVARNFSIGSALVGRTPMNNPNFAELAAVMERKGAPIEVVARGDIFQIGDSVVEILYPLETDDPQAASDNNHSIVVRIVYGSRAFLFTADIERPAENDILDRGGALRADVIKVPHHGSRTSSTQEFITAVRPTFAVISVGRTSPFGHPHPDVVERWKMSDAAVLTTGEKGMISVSTDGHDLEIETFIK